jgi:hypothetical protein
MAAGPEPHQRRKAPPATARDLLRAAANLLPEGAAADGGITAPGVLAQFDACVPDYLLDCLVELGHANRVSSGYWLLLRRAAWLLPDVHAGAYHRRHALPRPGSVRRPPGTGTGTDAHSLLLARRRSEGA